MQQTLVRTHTTAFKYIEDMVPGISPIQPGVGTLSKGSNPHRNILENLSHVPCVDPSLLTCTQFVYHQLASYPACAHNVPVTCGAE